MKLNQNLQKAKDLFREKKIKHEINFERCNKSPTSLNENILCIMNSPFHQQLKKSTQSYEKKMAFARHGRSTSKTKKHFLASFCALQITSQSQIFFGERHQIKSQEFPHQLCMDLILSVCGGQTNLFYEITETLVCIQPSYLNKI